MQITIKSIHVTEMHEKTWGRVYIQYTKNNQECFIFKNWLYFDEKTYVSDGNLTSPNANFNNENIDKHHSIYLFFPPTKRHVFSDYQDVLNGKADHLFLTPSNFKSQYGTPSIILKHLLIELKANLAEPLENRTGWYKRYQNPELVLSELTVNTKNKILLSLYDIEIKLEPLLKVVYLLFLNHLDGIKLKEISNHSKELNRIYTKLSPNTEIDKVSLRIDELLNTTNNSLHQKISKINKIFKDELGDKISPFYQISGSAGQPYKINLSSNLICISK